MNSDTLQPLSINRFKRIRQLKQKKYRQSEGKFLIEGVRLVESALEAETELRDLIVTPDFVESPAFEELDQKYKLRDYHPAEATEKQFKELSDTVTPSGILAVCPIPPNPSPGFGQPLLYLDRIRDPGNCGTLLRTAAWLGLKSVAFSPESPDPFQPKVVRGGMGAHFHLDLNRNLKLSVLSEAGYTIIGADHRGTPIKDLQLPENRPWALVLGNEAHGLSDEVRNRADILVSISKRGFGESLNVAVSGALLLYELVKRSDH